MFSPSVANMSPIGKVCLLINRPHNMKSACSHSPVRRRIQTHVTIHPPTSGTRSDTRVPRKLTSSFSTASSSSYTSNHSCNSLCWKFPLINVLTSFAVEYETFSSSFVVSCLIGLVNWRTSKSLPQNHCWTLVPWEMVQTDGQCWCGCGEWTEWLLVGNWTEGGWTASAFEAIVNSLGRSFGRWTTINENRGWMAVAGKNWHWNLFFKLNWTPIASPAADLFICHQTHFITKKLHEFFNFPISLLRPQSYHNHFATIFNSSPGNVRFLRSWSSSHWNMCFQFAETRHRCSGVRYGIPSVFAAAACPAQYGIASRINFFAGVANGLVHGSWDELWTISMNSILKLHETIRRRIGLTFYRSDRTRSSSLLNWRRHQFAPLYSAPRKEW